MVFVRTANGHKATQIGGSSPDHIARILATEEQLLMASYQTIPTEEDSFPKEELDRLSKRAWILEYVGPNTTGAEIGVFRGHFSEIIFSKVKPQKLYLVDLWTKGGERFNWGDD